MLVRDDITPAKRIVWHLLSNSKNANKVAVCYRRLDKTKVKVPHCPINTDLQTDYLWERVNYSKRDSCWSWQVVLVDPAYLKSLPKYIPVWEDDPKNGQRSNINFRRMGLEFSITQADLPLVSRLIGEPISKKHLANEIRCWYVVKGEFIPSNKQFSRNLISLRNKVLKLKIGFGVLFKATTDELEAMGIIPSEAEVINQLKRHSKEKP